MPHEKINYPDSARQQAVVGWNKIGWVQLSIFPEGWNDTGDATRVDLSAGDIEKLIKVLKRAKRQAYSQMTPHADYADRDPMPKGSSLFRNENHICDLHMFGLDCPGFLKDIPVHETDPGPELHEECLRHARKTLFC